jgi:hypothetical protein
MHTPIISWDDSYAPCTYFGMSTHCKKLYFCPHLLLTPYSPFGQYLVHLPSCFFKSWLIINANILYASLTLQQILPHNHLIIREPNTTLPYCCILICALQALILPLASTP